MAAANSGSVGRGRAFVAPYRVRTENTQVQKSGIDVVVDSRKTTPVSRQR